MSAPGRYCCKSQKLVGDDFLAAGRFNRRPPICVASIGLPRSLASLSSGDEVPHIFTGESPLRLREFLIISPKRLLQQYRERNGRSTPFWRGRGRRFCPVRTFSGQLQFHSITSSVRPSS